jgi:hypothetical protein
MIRIEHLKINSTMLFRIEQIMKYLLKKSPVFDVGTIKNYSSFPEISLDWNEYLLIGIIKTFLKDEFEIKATGNMYDKVKYYVTLQGI